MSSTEGTKQMGSARCPDCGDEVPTIYGHLDGCPMETRRDALAAILGKICEDGLEGPRDLDAALDAIETLFEPPSALNLSRAAFEAEKNSRSMAATPDGWPRITPESHPLIHAAFSAITHDGGGGADHPWYNVPPGWARILQPSENALGELSAEDRETFAIGERSEQEAIAQRVGYLKVTHAMLNAFFEDFADNEAPDQPPVAKPGADGVRHSWTWMRDGLLTTVTFTLVDGVPKEMQLFNSNSYRLHAAEKRMDESDWEELAVLIINEYKP